MNRNPIRPPHPLLVLFAVVGGMVSTAVAQPAAAPSRLTASAPAAAGMSAKRLARIDRMCREAVEQNKIPGVVALVARQGKVVYHKAFGMADNGAKRTLKKDDIFRIASQSKAVTATAVMMLWEEGRFGDLLHRREQQSLASAARRRAAGLQGRAASASKCLG